jgi:hypothetical protein
MVPPSAADGRSDDERDDRGDTENERCCLPFGREFLLRYDGLLLVANEPLLLLGNLLLLPELLLGLGELLFSVFTSALLGGNVIEQRLRPRRADDEREHGEGDG